jgi:hypothetical protein
MVEQIGMLTGMVQATKGLQEIVNPAPMPDDPLMALAPKALDVIGGFLANQTAQRTAQQGPQSPRPALPAPQPGARLAQPNPSPQGPAIAPQAPQMDAQMTDEQRAAAEIKAAIEKVNMLASMGVSSDTAANLVYEQAPDDVFELLHLPDWFDQLVKVVPSIEPHRAWYLEVGAKVLEIEKEASIDEAAPATVEEKKAA